MCDCDVELLNGISPDNLSSHQVKKNVFISILISNNIIKIIITQGNEQQLLINKYFSVFSF